MANRSSEGGFEGIVRRMLPFTSAAIIVAALYMSWVFYSRWNERREFDRKRTEATAQKARTEYEMSGGSALKIMALNATPGVINRGQTIQLCYSVVNAKAVSFEPKVEGIWPSRSRCVEVSPRKDTTYVLTASDEGGHSEKAEVKVLVR